MKFAPGSVLLGASVYAIACSAFVAPAIAQDDAGIESGEIVVTARRKDERLQDVPLTVNAVSSEDLNKLNIRRFDEIASTVPGLNMTTDSKGYAPTASVRGINYDTNASGLNGTVEFYLNDAPISAGALFQTMYDMGQVELLRGPQGTLRGRASPSGSMTVTTHRVNMSELGGYVSGTATDIGGINANGALNIPLIPDVLAIRVAALVDENEGNRVRSINNGTKPYSRTASQRISVRFEPTSNLKFDFMYQKMIQNSRSFDQVMTVRSAPDLDSGTAGTQYYGTTDQIGAFDRLSVEDQPRPLRQEYHILNWGAEWAFSGQKLNYVGSFWRQKVDVSDTLTADPGDFFGTGVVNSTSASPLVAYYGGLGPIPALPDGRIADIQNFGYQTHSEARNYSHELRLSSEEPLFGKVDYIIGGFMSQLTSPTDLLRPTAFVSPDYSTGSILYVQTARRGQTKEKSLFGNLTYHLGEATEISGGGRYIYFESLGSLLIPTSGIPWIMKPWQTTENKHWNAVIYSASVKHRFNDNLMVYANVGKSWRPGISVVGDFNDPLTLSANERLFTQLDPEKSTSYELGFKSSFLNKRIKLNATYYHQDFKNYPYRAAGLGVPYVDSTSTPKISMFNFVGPVPVKVDGVEVETSFQVNRNWNIGGNFTYAKGTIKNGYVPCDDGSVSTSPLNVGPAGCFVTANASTAPKWAANIQSEYSRPISDNVTGYLRGMASLYGKVTHDAANDSVEYPSYALLNLYAGIRDPKGAWEVSLYGKNITNTKRVLSSTPLYMSGTVNSTPTSSFLHYTPYNGITTTAPREFGLSLRYAFGSR